MKKFVIPVVSGLITAACASSGPADNAGRSNEPERIIGKSWEWQQTVTPVEKISVADPSRYTLQLQSDGRAVLRFDCNRGGGSYRIEPGKLSFGPMMSTRMACPEDSQDAIFMKQLQDATSFFIENESLYLELPYDSGTMMFRQRP